MEHVVIVGAGALGSFAAELLARSGISFTIIDRDYVESSNLERQFLYSKSDVGTPKAAAAKKQLAEINPKSHIKAIVADLSYRNASLLDGASLILDCTDNFGTRYLINDYCRKKRISWIYSAVIRDTGMLYAIRPAGPCFSCIFPSHHGTETCDTAGVLSSAVSATASLQIAMALSVIDGKPFDKTLLRLNVQKPELLKLNVRKNPRCSACRGAYDYLSGRRGFDVVQLCGTGSYQVRGPAVNLTSLSRQLRKKKVKVAGFGRCIHFSGITLFSDGRAIIKADSEEKARSIYSKFVG